MNLNTNWTSPKIPATKIPNPPIQSTAKLSVFSISMPSCGYIILSLPSTKYLATNGVPVYDLLECTGAEFQPNDYPELYARLKSNKLPLKTSSNEKLKYYVLADLHA